MKKTITESGMTFGPFHEKDFFYIEKSQIYSAIKENIKIAEFLLLKTKKNSPPTVLILEAKSSTPQPSTQPAFNDFIQEIKEKLVNAFSLGVAVCLKRHENGWNELPSSFQKLDFSKADFKFILVIKKHREEWLPPVHEILRRALISTLKTWGVSTNNVAVLNEQMAIEHGLING